MKHLRTYESYNIEGDTLMNYINFRMGDEYVIEDDYVGMGYNPIYRLYLDIGGNMSTTFNKNNFNIQTIKGQIEEVSREIPNTTFDKILDILDDEESIDLYIDNNEIGLL